MTRHRLPPHLQSAARAFERELEAENDLDVSPDMLLLTDYLAGELNEGDASAVERRLETDAEFATLAQPLMQLWDGAAQHAAVPPSTQEVEESWTRFWARAGRHPEQGPELAQPRDWLMGRRMWLVNAAVLAIAAFASLASFGLRLFPDFMQQHSHVVDGGPNGRSVTVSGRNRVWLGAGAQLVYTDPESERAGIAMRFEGSGRFSLYPVSFGAYQVITPSAIIEVTGTTFEVDATNPSETRVKLLEGKVIVSSRGMTGGAMVMAPGETVVAAWGRAPRRAE